MTVFVIFIILGGAYLLWTVSFLFIYLFIYLFILCDCELDLEKNGSGHPILKA